jgi:hypothetical protein
VDGEVRSLMMELLNRFTKKTIRVRILLQINKLNDELYDMLIPLPL